MTKETVLKITTLQQEDWGKDTFICPYCGWRTYNNLTLNLETTLCDSCFNERYILKIDNKLTHLELYDHPPMRCLDCLYQNFNVEITKKEVK